MRRGRGLRRLPGLVVCIAAGCVAFADNPDDPQVRRSATADDLLIVHCSLPGQIRQLGRHTTYLSARQPVRTTALDCRVRGGEYVVHDRANLKTALNVWLEKAKSGNPEAETTVGEIFEQGLGVPPDYAVAAQWYERAAEDGFERALINLGFLYEQGRGVPLDPSRALEYYRRAAGLDAAVAFEPGAGPVFTGASTGSESRALHARITELESEKQTYKLELAAAQKRLSEALAHDVAFADDAKARVGQAVLDAARQRELVEAQQNAMAELQEQLATMQDSLAGRDAEIDALRAAIRDDSASESSAIEDLRSELLARQNEASEERKVLEDALRQSDARLSEVTAEYAEREALLNQELRTYMARLAQREAALASQTDQTEQLMREVQALRRARFLASPNAPPVALSERILAGPTITLIDPMLPSTRAAETRGLIKVSLQSSVTQRPVIGQVQAPAGLLSLTVNDERATPNDAGVFRIDVPVRGETGVHVAAIDQQGKRADLHFAFADPARSPPGDQASANRPIGINLGKNHALLIGNNEYRNLPDLLTPINDVRRLGTILSTRYGFEVTTLENADRYEMLSALNELREQLTSDDNLLVYYAGHGELDETNQRGHWLPVDAEPDSTANWVSNVSITDILNVIAAKQVLLVVDSCYSGTLTRSSIARLEKGMTDAERQSWLKLMSQKRARVVLTSGGLAPVLDFGGGDHSVFAKAFVEVLESNTDLLTGRSLHQAIAARVAHAAANYEFEQLPEYAPIARAGHEAGDFFLLPI